MARGSRASQTPMSVGSDADNCSCRVGAKRNETGANWVWRIPCFMYSRVGTVPSLGAHFCSELWLGLLRDDLGSSHAPLNRLHMDKDADPVSICARDAACLWPLFSKKARKPFWSGKAGRMPM